jgi:transglutaminase-like putative cysteine protease
VATKFCVNLCDSWRGLKYVDAMKLGIRYETEYSYDEPVGFSPHDIRLFPKGGRFVRVRRLDFTTRPEATVRFSHDVFDNTIASCFFPERSPELHLRLAIDLELEKRDPFHFLLENYAVDLPFTYERLLLPILEPYRERRTSKELQLPRWLAPTRKKPRSTVSALVELNQTIHEAIGYERREEGIAREPTETLWLGRGACRDVAVLLAEILREMGLAARLASGYLRETDAKSRRAEGSLHAWTEVFLPGAGWIGLDATNGVFCNHNFISTAVGLTPADITPVSGSYYHKEEIPARMTSRLELLNL